MIAADHEKRCTAGLYGQGSRAGPIGVGGWDVLVEPAARNRQIGGLGSAWEGRSGESLRESVLLPNKRSWVNVLSRHRALIEGHSNLCTPCV